MRGRTFSNRMTGQHVPVFSPTTPRHDMSTFSGRCRYFYDINDLRRIVTSTGQLHSAQRLLAQYSQGELPAHTTDADLWEARSIVESMVHPETGQVIPVVFRFSSFVPVNILLALSMLSPTVIGSVGLTMAVHWANQSYNAAINYAHRNASNPIPTRRLVEGYAGAVSTSLVIGLAATVLSRRIPGLAVRATLPFLAVAGAGSANVVLMRRNELEEGVDVFDAQGNVLGKSVAAGQTGLLKCSAARVLWNIPIMVIPPLIMSRLEKLPLLARSPRGRLAAEATVIFGCLMAGVSPALAAFPQRDRVPARSLEPEFHALYDSEDHTLIEHVFYNKGL